MVRLGRSMLCAACLALAPGAGALDLDDYRWRQRVLVLAAPTADDTLLARQRATIADRADAVDDRELVVIELYGRRAGRLGERTLTAPEVARLRARVNLAEDTRSLLLIGKDGGVKRRAPLDTDLREVFVQIDGMPMRRAEMREKREAGLPVTTP